jgi:hypothetical protein
MGKVRKGRVTCCIGDVDFSKALKSSISAPREQMVNVKLEEDIKDLTNILN